MDKYLYFSTIPIAIFLMVYLKPRIILLLYTKGLGQVTIMAEKWYMVQDLYF